MTTLLCSAPLSRCAASGERLAEQTRRRTRCATIPAPNFELTNSELWGGLIGLALGIFVIWAGVKLKLGSINDPGSGYVLFYTGILMCLFAATIVIAAVAEGGLTFSSRWQGARWTKPAVLIAFLAVYCFALEPLGFSRLVDPADAAVAAGDRPARWPPAICPALAPLGVWWVLKRQASDPVARWYLRPRLSRVHGHSFNVVHGFGVALLPTNLLYCFIGVFIGTLVGVLPGIGPISAMSLLLPVTLSGT